MATIFPGKALGSLSLGSSLQSVISVLKANPTVFPSIKISYSKHDPVQTPITINLKYNGLRLRFDGQNQKLRLIEVIEWGKMALSYKKREVGYVALQVKPYGFFFFYPCIYSNPLYKFYRTKGPLTYAQIYNTIFGYVLFLNCSLIASILTFLI